MIRGRELKVQHVVKNFQQNSRSLKNVTNHCLKFLIQISSQLRQTKDNIEISSFTCKCQKFLYQINSINSPYLASLLKVGLCLVQRNPDQGTKILM